jgi:hypothetical protein
MNFDLTEQKAAALLKELNGIIDGDRYFLSPLIQTLKAIRAKIRPEPVREPVATAARAICTATSDGPGRDALRIL